jgi:hypothetical protein
MKALSYASVVLALSGMACTTQTIPGPLVVSTRAVPELGAGGAGGKRVVGRSCGRAVLLIIPVGIGTVESAYDDALSQAPGADTVVDFEQRTTNLFIFPFYYEICTELHGVAVSSKSRSAAVAAP